MDTFTGSPRPYGSTSSSSNNGGPDQNAAPYGMMYANPNMPPQHSSVPTAGQNDFFCRTQTGKAARKHMQSKSNNKQNAVTSFFFLNNICTSPICVSFCGSSFLKNSFSNFVKIFGHFHIGHSSSFCAKFLHSDSDAWFSKRKNVSWSYEKLFDCLFVRQN